jgi:hypothetical protein
MEERFVQYLRSVEAYISSIKFYHRENEITLELQVIKFFDGLIERYKRFVADKNNKGVMSQKEGSKYQELSRKALFAFRRSVLRFHPFPISSPYFTGICSLVLVQ